MYNNTSGGIHFGDIGNVITGNKIFKNGTGISTQNCCTYGTNTITHNAISENEKGIQYDGKGGMRLEIENNHLINTHSRCFWETKVSGGLRMEEIIWFLRITLSPRTQGSHWLKY